MILEFRRPSEVLAPFIEHYVYHDAYLPAHSKECLLPDGGIDLIIDLSDIPKNLYDNDDYNKIVAFKHGWISGMHMERITIQAGLGTPMLVIRFKPGGAWAFFGFPMAELADHVEELTSVWGPLFEELRERLLEMNDHRLFFPILEAFFLGLGRGRLDANPFIGYAVATLEQAVVPPSMRELAAKLGYSQKHLITLFEKWVGLSPKRYARIMRFQKLIHALEAGQPLSWARFAHRFGFYDQAHFINEFRAFAGMTPARYLSSKGDFLNYLPID